MKLLYKLLYIESKNLPASRTATSRELTTAKQKHRCRRAPTLQDIACRMGGRTPARMKEKRKVGSSTESLFAGEFAGKSQDENTMTGGRISSTTVARRFFSSQQLSWL